MFELSDLPRPLIRYGVGVWRRRWTVVAVAWAAALLGWAAVWLLPDKYESRAHVFVQTESLLDPVMHGVTTRPNYEQRVEVMRLQLLTRPNVEQVIYRAGLDKTIKAGSEIERRAKMENLVDWVASEIKVESPREMYFVISYKFGDPEIAKNVVDAVLNLLIEQDLGASIAEREEARRLLDREIAEFDGRLTAKEREVADFRRANAADLAAAESSVRRREGLEAELLRIDDQIAQGEQRAATLRALLSSTPRASAGNELDQLKIQLAQLRSQYQENYPDIQVIKARIAELEGSAAGALPDNPEFIRLRNELRAADDVVAGLRLRRQTVAADLSALAIASGATPAVEAELQKIVRDYEQTQKSYEELLARRDRLSLTSNLGAGGRGVDYQVYERPTAALRPTDPPRLILILLALVASLAAGVGAAMLLTLLDRSFTQPEDLQAAFDLPVLGSLSAAPSVFAQKAQKTERIRLAAAVVGLMFAALLYIYLDVLRLPAEGKESGARTAAVTPEVSAL